jgi:hypothetical protein
MIKGDTMEKLFGIATAQDSFYLGDTFMFLNRMVRVKDVELSNRLDMQGASGLPTVIRVKLVDEETGDPVESICIPTNRTDLTYEVASGEKILELVARRAAEIERQKQQREEQKQMFGAMQQAIEAAKLQAEKEAEDEIGDGPSGMPNGAEHGPTTEDLDPEGPPPVIEDEDVPGAETLEDAEAEALSEDAADDAAKGQD